MKKRIKETTSKVKQRPRTFRRNSILSGVFSDKVSVSRITRYRRNKPTGIRSDLSNFITNIINRLLKTKY